jgi:hypothetical protein
MADIGLIIFVCIWGAIAIWIGAKLSNFKLFTRYTQNAETGIPTWRDLPVKVGLIIFIFFLPLADEILSYPAYHKLCENGGKYQFAPGMDERKVFGRYYRTKVVEEKLIRLFPDFQTIPASEANSYGVVIKATKIHLIDDKSNEVLLVSEGFKPIRSAFAISWDGSRITWLLHECSNLVGSNGADSQKYIRALQLHPTYRWD